MEAKQKLQNIIDQLDVVLADAEKADNGNKSAAIRVRLAAQAGKAALQELRIHILEAVK